MSDLSTKPVWPNFLIIGAAKAGTTALYNQLKQHPDIFMSPVKEPAFFAHEGGALDYRGPGDESARSRIVTTLDDYLRNFEEVHDEQAVGEASVVYLYHPEAPARIKHYLPDVRLVAILRNPVDRAFSNYLDNVRHGFEPKSFGEALAAESERAEAGWSWYWRYRDIGFYGRQLERYLGYFDRERIGVYFYEDYVSNPVAVLRDVFTFLEVDERFEPDVSLHYNVSGIPRSSSLEKLVKQPNLFKLVVRRLTGPKFRRRVAHSAAFQRLMKKRPGIPHNVAQDLRRTYADDVELLENLTGRDLTHWTQ